MKNGNTRRPYIRRRDLDQTGREHARSHSEMGPVFQPLEPRKLLTTLYANPDFGYTNVFSGWIAMPRFITPELEELDAANVEERSVRVNILLVDPTPGNTATVTILDLDGNPLFPWLGQPDGNGGFNTEIEISLATGEEEEGGDNDGFWGTEDDITESVFGLDSGYHPGWRWEPGPDQELFTSDDIVQPDAYFNPVRDLTFEEDSEEETVVDIDFDGGIPDEVTIEDLVGGANVVWTTDDAAGENNYTGGQALAATASERQGGGAFDTTLKFAADLTDWTAADLVFKLNYQNNGNDVLDIEISTDGSNWTRVQRFQEDVGLNRGNNSGEEITVEIDEFAQQGIEIRFRYTDPDGNAIYAQIDDVEVVGKLSGWDTENIPDDYTRVIPQTGFWLPGMDGLYNGGGSIQGPFGRTDFGLKAFGWSETADDTRLPTGFEGGGSDERLPDGGDPSTWLEIDDTNYDPWLIPSVDQTEFHLVDITVDPEINPNLESWAAANATRARHAIGQANDGIADFNNGIGQIIFSNTTRATKLIISVLDDDGLSVAPYQLSENEKIGSDLDRAPGATGVIQPVAFGPIVIGNNTNTDWTADNSDAPLLPDGIYGTGWQNYQFDADPDFPDRLPEGISFLDPDANESVGDIIIDGALFGINRFPGAVENINVGYFGGGIIVDGEFDGMVVAGTSTFIEYSDGQTRDTQGFIDVGRNLGSFVVAGVTSTEVIVRGDLVSTEDRPILRTSQQNVVEWEVDIDNADQDAINANFAVGNLLFALPVGEDDAEEAQYIINDTRGQAQYVGRLTARSEVFGTIGGTPLAGPHTGTDNDDYFAIAVDGRAELRLQIFDSLGQDMPVRLTIEDATGRVLASRSISGEEGEIRYTPDQAGLLYVHINNTPGFTTANPYRLVIQGIEGVTLGEYNAFRPMRFPSDGGSAIVTNFGSIGTVRTGQDAIEAGQAWMANVAIDAADSVWNVTAGHSIGHSLDEDGGTGSAAPVFITASNYIGTILAGYGTGEGGDALLGGSVVSGLISAGEDIGRIHALGNARNFGDIGGYATNATLSAMDSLVGTLTIESGGSIGVLSADNRIFGGTIGTFIEIGSDAQIDLIEASAILTDAEGAANRDLNMDPAFSGVVANGVPLQITSSSSLGSNVRFVRTPSALSVLRNDDALEIGPDETIQLVDDSGAVFSVTVTGGTTFGGDSTSAARIVSQPVEGSQGVAVTRIIANLHFGADLIITNNSGNVEIGDIIVVSNGQFFDSGSEIILNGSGKTDVYMMRAIGTFDSIRNNTSGDIVALDVGRTDEVVWNGHLGRVQNLVEIGPSLIGPDMGATAVSAATAPLQGDVVGLDLVAGSPVAVGWTVGGPLQIDTNAGVNTADPDADGGPFDNFLNGVSVRANTFNTALELVRTNGALGDLIVQTTIERIVVNADGFTPDGDFHGVEGTVHSRGNIEFINVGDGVLPHTKHSPSLTAGITAIGQVEHVFATGEGHYIQGAIAGIGTSALNDVRQNVDYGIGRVQAQNGADIRGAIIATNGLGGYWDNGEGGSGPFADIDQIDVSNASMIDTDVNAINIERITINGGVWDTNSVSAIQNIDRLIADHFVDTTDRTTTIGMNFFGLDNVNSVVASGNLSRIETTGRNGDIEDLLIDLEGDLDRMRARNVEGVVVLVDNIFNRLDAGNLIARSLFTVGSFERIQAQSDIARVTMQVAGPIKKFQSKQGSITRLDLTIDGPDGTLSKMDAFIDITGSISVSGPINKMQARNGDIIASITTFSGDGDVNKLQAARDLAVDLEIDGGLKKAQAGRNFGNGGQIIIRGDTNKIDARNGTINGQFTFESYLKKLDAGAWTAGTNIAVRDYIKKMTVGDDVDGSIRVYGNGINNLTIDGAFIGGAAITGLTENQIAAFNSTIDKLTIVGDAGGHIFADQEIKNVDIRSGNDMAGNFTGVVESRTNVENFSVAGSAFEAVFHALFAFEKLTLAGSLTDSIIGAGKTLGTVQIGGTGTDSAIIAGLDSLGTDYALGGGTLAERDRYSEGVLEKAIVSGGISGMVFSAGVRAGNDGDFTTLDPNTDLAAGKSIIESVSVSGEAINGNLVLADTAINSASFSDPTPDVTVQVVDADDPTLPGVGTQFTFSNGSPVSFTESDGDVVTAWLTGAGTGMLEVDGTGDITAVVYLGTDNRTDSRIFVSGGSGDGEVRFDSATLEVEDDQDFRSFELAGRVFGSASMNFDADVDSFVAHTVDTTGTIGIGGVTDSFQLHQSLAGIFQIAHVEDFRMTQSGFSGTLTSQYIDTFAAVGDVTDATIWGRDGINAFATTGAFGVDPVGPGFSPAYIASNVYIGAFQAGSVAQAQISAGDHIQNVTVETDVVDSRIMGGFILGSDARIGGTGVSADRLTAGTVDNVTVKRDFIRSSIAGGVRPGSDQFYGTGDDVGSLGQSSVNNVNIRGRAIGSQTFSQNYAFITTGDMPDIRVQGGSFSREGNLENTVLDVTPVPVQVESLNVRLDGEEFIGSIQFTLDVTTSAISSPTEPSAISVTAAETGGVDPVEDQDYEVEYDEETFVATISFNRAFTEANPGVYTITVDSDILESRSGIGLDGNADGKPGDDYAKNILIGDAGDRTEEAQLWDHDTDPDTPAITFKAPSNLNLVLDDLIEGDGTRNNPIRIVEIIGDHPEHDSLFFPDKLDVDLYAITVQEGDIVRAELSTPAGSAFLGAMTLRNPEDGSIVASQTSLLNGAIMYSAGTFLLEVTGQGLSGLQALSPPFTQLDITDGSGFIDLGLGIEIPPAIVVNDIGRYQVDVTLFNDGDTAFNEGAVNQPHELTLTNGVTTRVESSIGRPDSIGFPNPLEDTFIDVDVWEISRLKIGNSEVNTIPEGTTVTMSLNVEEFGSDIGPAIELAIFLVDDPETLYDAQLVGAPYAVDGSEDLEYTVQVPTTGQYAVLVQGSRESNYALDLTVNVDSAGDRYGSPREQNVFLELNGGFADWLDRFGQELSAFSLEQLGFEDMEQQILNDVVSQVRDKFADAGVTVNVSTRVNDFGGEEFTTVFMASNFGQDNSFGDLLGIAESLDPLNRDEAEQVVVYVNSHDFFAPGQEDLLANELSNTITHEVAHSLGLRHQFSLDDGLMGFSSALGLPLEFSSNEYLLREIFLGLQTEVQLLEWIFDID